MTGRDRKSQNEQRRHGEFGAEVRSSTGASRQIKSRVDAKIARGDFLGQMLFMARNKSSDVQKDFIEQLTNIGISVRMILEESDMIQHVDYQPKIFWPNQRGRSFCFVDGGVANIELPSAAPLGIRVGTYIVKPGIDDDSRESFNMALSLVDDLYSETGWLYDEFFHDTVKLRDAARIVAELAAVLRVWRSHPNLDGIFLHGPLVNPASPYGSDDFPAYSLKACRKLLGHFKPNATEDKTSFVEIYLELLNAIQKENAPSLGVIERSLGHSTSVLDKCLRHLVNNDMLSSSDAVEIRTRISDYQLNDARLFDVVLAPGEYIRPINVDRQGPDNSWPDRWKYHISSYPNPLTTYLKPNEESEPFRIETLSGVEFIDNNIDLLYHTSRLLPTYGFPVGLDIVDKFAKVPAWMTKSVRGQHAIVLLKHALDKRDPKVLSLAKRVLTMRGRDWLFRPNP